MRRKLCLILQRIASTVIESLTLGKNTLKEQTESISDGSHAFVLQANKSAASRNPKAQYDRILNISCIEKIVKYFIQINASNKTKAYEKHSKCIQEKAYISFVLGYLSPCAGLRQ